jgi:hypothetical protein
MGRSKPDRKSVRALINLKNHPIFPIMITTTCTAINVRQSLTATRHQEGKIEISGHLGLSYVEMGGDIVRQGRCGGCANWWRAKVDQLQDLFGYTNKPSPEVQLIYDLCDSDVMSLEESCKLAIEQFAVEFEDERRSMADRVSAHTEYMGMQQQDFDVQNLIVNEIREPPEAVRYYTAEMAQLERDARYYGIEHTAEETAEFRSASIHDLVEAFSESYDFEEDRSNYEIYEEWRLLIASRYLQVDNADGNTMILRRPIRQNVYKGSFLGRHGIIILNLEPLARYYVHKKVLLADVCAGLALNARARWGLLEETKANQLMVGRHMRKQLFTLKFPPCMSDNHVVFALNAFFTPLRYDILARQQALSVENKTAWRTFNRTRHDLPWWRYGGSVSGPPSTCN